jgi:hypothetical protein
MFLCLCVFQVAVNVHATLSQQSAFSVKILEDGIVSEYKLCLATDDPRKEELKRLLAKLESEMVLVPSDSIGCYFICSSQEHLIQLRRHFISGVMQNVLEKIFSGMGLLVNT